MHIPKTNLYFDFMINNNHFKVNAMDWNSIVSITTTTTTIIIIIKSIIFSSLYISKS